MNELASKYPYLKGAPVISYKKAIPRLLIGINNAKLMLPLKSREGHSNGLVVSKTRLGWTVYGKCNFDEPPNNSSVHAIFHNFHVCESNRSDDGDLHNLVKEFFAVDSDGIRSGGYNQETPENKRAHLILQQTTKHETGRFCTGLLWRYDNVRLPNSLPMAKNRLQCLMKRMERDQELLNTLNAQIEMYLKKGYARKLLPSEISNEHPRIWYLPIFPVRNPNKPNKTRLVWDAAAKVNNISLNSVLMKGPDMLTSLPALLHRFRERKIALCADIQEMFHQVMIRPDDQHSQRFLWPNPNSMEPDIYVMQVMTFGATCSPSCAQYVKNHNAAEFKETHPRAYQAITQNHYVDDLLDSVESECEAVELAEQIKFIHARAGFNIRNWRSNSKLVLESLGENSSHMKNLTLNSEMVIGKVLGLWWNSDDDTFTYSLTFNKSNEEILFGRSRPTKRELLRTIASIFDPLGLLANYLVHAKIILQQVWRTGISWDEPIKDLQFEKWLNWLKLLPEVENIKIPRWYGCRNEVQLHVFVDASEDAYGAVAYLRFDDHNEIRCTLVGGKTRVAPLKMQSIPRLELEACLLGARFANAICEGHSLQISRRWFWSDSKTALAWIKSDHRKYRQYVAFRVSEILDISETSEWHWITSKTNIADQLTKWHKNTLDQTSSWLSGPSFLHEPENTWPYNNTICDTDEEIKANCLHVVDVNSTIIDSHRFSNWNKLVRSVVMVLRFINNANRHKLKITGGVTSDEYKAAENALYRQAQVEFFAYERDILIQNMNVSPSERTQLRKDSPIAKLSPFIDDAKVMRVSSRIQQADVPLDMKQPVILPKDSHISFLIINLYHQKYHHIFHETAFNELRQKYYIPQLRTVLKKVRRDCQQCKNATAKPAAPEMAILPAARVSTFCRPFTYVGIDYFGPINVTVGRATVKRWGVIFTCLSVRAVHLEISYSMTTDSCILCIENFINRRGQPAEIFCDNGTNLKGAENELAKALQNLDQQRLSERFMNNTTKWNFNPPSSPHMGGSWERLIRSIKSALKQITPKQNPSDDLLLNIMIAVENIINSRPLTYIPLECETDEALTPTHFLVGCSNGNKPKGDFTDDGVIWRRNWQKAQQYADLFWRRWIREYLPNFTRRTKWFKPVKPLEKGDIVVIVDELSPRNCWQKGIVLDVTLSKDGQVRKAMVQTESGIYTRPAVKLAVLDVKRNELSKPIQIDVLGESVRNRDAMEQNI